MTMISRQQAPNLPSPRKNVKRVSVKSSFRTRTKFSLSYYMKHVLWKALRRYIKKKRRERNKKKYLEKQSVAALDGVGPQGRIGSRDFWGSRYGTEWFLTKHRSEDRHRLIEIVDAFKTVDLKYSKRHRDSRIERIAREPVLSMNSGRSSRHTGSSKKCSYLETLRACSYIMHRPTQRQMCSCTKSNVISHSSMCETDSDWSLSTMQLKRRPYSRWPPSRPSKTSGSRTYLQHRTLPLESVLSRLNTYVYNWLYIDQIQALCKTRDLEKLRNNRKLPRVCQPTSSPSVSNTYLEPRPAKDRKSRVSSKHNRAKEKASIQWLLSKAFNGTIPGDLQEPFYRDHERQSRLKPKIVHSLASAELYCLSLANIYADPNYHNLDHHGIIQALMRKGIFLVESKDAPLTETVLVQTAPFRMNAHMAVIDGIMSLYIKEVLIPEKIIEVVRGFSCLNLNSEMPSNPEEAAVLWINKCCKTLEYEIQVESKSFDQESSKLPRIPVLQEISDISDGCSIAAVISFYCPDCLNWRDICWNEPMSLGDSIYNLNLIRNFCSRLPRNIFFLTLEDFLYLHPSIKDNVLAFVADLLYLFVIWPTSCVTRSVHDAQSETSHTISEDSKQLKNCPLPQKIEQIPCTQIPNLKGDSHGGSTSSLPDRVGLRIPSGGPKEKLLAKHFSSRKTSLSNEALELSYQIQRTSSAGLINGKSANISHFSPVNSLKALRHYGSGDEGTIFGESHSSVSFPYIGDDREQYSSKFKESKVVNNSADPWGKETCAENSSNIRKLDSVFPPYHKRSFVNDLLSDSSVIENGDLHHKLEGRQSVCLEDYYKRLANEDGVLRSNSTSNIGENKNLKNVKNRYILESEFSPNYKMVLDPSGTFSPGMCVDDINNKNNLSTTSFAQLSKLKCPIGNSINIVYMQHDRDGCNPGGDKNPLKSSFLQKQKLKNSKSGLEKKTTFATLPNTTTWQQQRAVSSRSPQTDSGHETPTEAADSSLNTQLCNVRMKLEERRRKIEQDKRRMEALWKRQRQKLGKAAFLQAVSKTSASGADTPDSGTGKDECENESPVTDKKSITNCRSPSSIRRMSIQEIEDDLDTVQRKWLDPKAVVDKYVPDAILSDVHIENEADESLSINAEDFQTSIEHLNCSLNDIQADISRISYQQEHIESLMQNNEDCEGKDTQFFLHEQHPATEFPEGLEDSLYCNEQNHQMLPHSPLLAEIGTHRGCYDYNRLSGQVPQQTMSANENRMLGPEHEQHLISLPPVTRDFSFTTDTPPQDYLYSKVVKKDGQNYANKQPHSLPCQDVSCKSTFSAPCSGSDMFSLLASQQKINDSVLPPKFSPVHKNQTFGRGIKNKASRNLFEETNSDSFLRKQQPYAYLPIHNVPQHAKQIAKANSSSLKGAKVSDDNGKVRECGGFYVSLDDQPKKSKPKSKIKSVLSEENPSDTVDKIILNNIELVQSRSVSRPATEKHSGQFSTDQSHSSDNAFGFVIGADLVHPDPEAENEMARKKEMIMLMSLRRRADQETKRITKEQENARLREEELRKKEHADKKREEERMRRQVILEQYRQKKIQEELEKEGISTGLQGLMGREHAISGKTCASKTGKLSVQGKKKDNRISSQFTKPIAELRSQISQNNQSRQSSKPRPKSAYLLSGGTDPASVYAVDCQANKRNSHYITSGGDGHDFDIDSLNSTSTSSSRRTHSPCNLSCHTSPTQGGSFPCEAIPKPTEGIFSGPSSEGTSDTASTASSAVAAEYTGPKLFVKPTAKSNKGIIINAINTVLAGAVNSETKRKVIEEINRSESKHFLILFRDAGCQFRAIYSYNPDREEVIKMYGIGPKIINDQIMDRFYKYNSGGKCFSEVQTKHLTVTIDAFTIPNSLWAGKKVIPPKKEFF